MPVRPPARVSPGLTDEERAAIEEFTARREITVVPEGAQVLRPGMTQGEIDEATWHARVRAERFKRAREAG